MSDASVEGLLAELNAATRETPVRLGRYDVVGRLGRGGMGTVYEAIDRERGTKVALKTLSFADSGAGVSLKREFRVVADVAHENLAAVYELASDRGVWFFTMEHVEGVSLTRWARDDGAWETPTSASLPVTRTVVRVLEATLRSPGETDASDATRERRAELPTRRVDTPFSGEELLAETDSGGRASPPTRDMNDLRRAFAALVSAVGALHQAGLRHGDVKPENVLVREDGRVVLVDFGLARPMNERRPVRGSSGGTPTFMAPEQFGTSEVGLEADWYAVGATLFRVLTGWSPFVASSMLDLYFKKLHQPPPSPRDLLADVPADLSRLCLDLMSPAPELRPNKEAILRVLIGEAGAPEPSTERRRRRAFVGRDAERARLEKAYGAARGGSLTLVHSHGPSGIGKSALLGSFLSAVQEVDSALVLRGRCYERETVPYKAFDRIFDAIAEHLDTLGDDAVRPLLPEWSGELGRAFPALGTVPAITLRTAAMRVAHDAIELRRRAWAALGELLGALRQRGPIVLAIDDLQWADADSAHLLEGLVRGARGGFLVVILYRPDEAAKNAALRGYFELARTLEKTGQLVDAPLGELGEREAEELARATLAEVGAPASESRARRLAMEARGVPFFIEELAHFVATRLQSTSDADVSVETAIMARVDALPPDQRALLEIVAVANNPLSQSVLFESAGLDAAALPALLALSSASLVSSLGAGADDTVSVYHDRIREALIGATSERRRLELHLAVGRALMRRHENRNGAWVFDAVRHLGAAAALIEDEAERARAASLHAEAGDHARRAAAFPLAFECFEGGIALLPVDAWETDYALTLRLHSGATEAAYLTAQWDVLDRRIADIKSHARSAMDQVAAWEAQIDALAGRHEYAAAVDVGLEVLALLGVTLPTDPTMAELSTLVTRTLGRLTEIGPQGLLAAADLTDPMMVAATRVQVRVSPAAYFGKPALLPVIACNLVTTSIDRGVSTATPYALALFGIVLNTIDQHEVAHRWGQLALELTERWPDRRLEAATKHLIFNLVCCWTVPLSSILEPLRRVFDIGCQTGDYEYAAYAAHGYVHNAMYAGKALAPLLQEALDLGAQMRALGQVNALHVHTPFEQLLKGLTGGLEAPWSLSGEGFDEAQLLAASEKEGSQSGIFVLSVAMGLARYFFGRAAEASACFERARSHIVAAPSVWHQPILHQFAALSACAAIATTTDATARATMIANAEASREALRKLAVLSPANFAHRVSMVDGALLHAAGDPEGALAKLDVSVREAHVGGWVNDVALGNELAATYQTDSASAKERLRAARAAYTAWGASAKSDQIASRIAELG